MSSAPSSEVSIYPPACPGAHTVQHPLLFHGYQDVPALERKGNMYAPPSTFASTNKTRGLAMPILSLPTTQHPTPQSWVPLLSVRHRSVGMCQALGHAVDADAADLGRRIPPAASVAAQACSGFRRPGEACVGVLLAWEMIPPFCLSLTLSPAPAKAWLSAPWARSRGSFCLLLCNLYVRDLAACPGPLFSCPSGSPCCSASTSLPHSLEQGDLCGCHRDAG